MGGFWSAENHPLYDEKDLEQLKWLNIVQRNKNIYEPIVDLDSIHEEDILQSSERV